MTTSTWINGPQFQNRILHELFAPFYNFKHGVADDKKWSDPSLYMKCLLLFTVLNMEWLTTKYGLITVTVTWSPTLMSKNISEHTQPVSDHTHSVQLVPIISSADVIMIKSFTLVVPTTTAITIILFVIVYTTHITLNFVVQQLPSSIGTLANKCSYGE